MTSADRRLRALEQRRREALALEMRPMSERSDEELEALAGTPTAEEQAWLDSLTDDELERLSEEGIMPDGRP